MENLDRMRRSFNARGLTLDLLVALTLMSNTVSAQDTVVVRSSGQGTWGSRPLRVIEELRIGMLDGPEHLIFGRIAGVVAGRDGTIYVADSQVPVIRMYSPTGQYLKNVGRGGAGPGEYRDAISLKGLKDGRLAVWDTRNARITTFNAQGDYLADIPALSFMYTSNSFEVDDAGNYYVKAAARQPTRESPDVDMIWLKISQTGSVLDSIPIPDDAPSSYVLSTPAGFLRPFVRQSLLALSPLGHLIVAHNDRYHLHVLRANLPPLRIERGYEPIRLTPGERREWEAWNTFFETRDPNNRRQMPPIPATKPAFREISVDEEGRIWVDRYGQAEERPGPERPAGDRRPRRVWQERRAFDAFSPDGAFLGTVELPDAVYIYARRGMLLWGVVAGDSDESYVVRYRIQR